MSLPIQPTGIIDHFLHPPIGLLSPWLDVNGPYIGNLTLTRFRVASDPVGTDHGVGDSFGVQVVITGAIPTNLGYRTGWASEDGLYDENVFDQPFLQLVVQHQYLSGAWVSTQVESPHNEVAIVQWSVAMPGRIGIFTAPGISVDLYYLRTGTPP